MKQDIQSVAQVRAKIRKRQTYVDQEFWPSEEFVELTFTPNFLNPFPDNMSIYDLFFDLKSNNWSSWEHAIKDYPTETKIPKSHQNMFVLTKETCANFYLF